MPRTTTRFEPVSRGIGPKPWNIEVHRHLGPGLLESAYEACVCAELSERGLKFERQRPLAINYKGAHLDCGYRLDLVVQDSILLELKAVERLLPIHEAQVITYLRLAGYPLACS